MGQWKWGLEMNTVSRSMRTVSTGEKPKGRLWANVSTVLNYALLAAQVTLLLFLTQRVTSLENTVRSGFGSNQPTTPTTLARNPDERGQVLGPANAAITIVEFSDFECPFCAEGSAAVKRLLSEYPNQIRLVYRHFPLPSHPHAQQAAEASECAARQGKFWEMHDLLFANHKNLSPSVWAGYASRIGLNTETFNTCLSQKQTADAVQQDLSDGRKYQVQGTPSFFVNGTMARGEKELDRTVRQMLART